MASILHDPDYDAANLFMATHEAQLAARRDPTIGFFSAHNLEADLLGPRVHVSNGAGGVRVPQLDLELLFARPAMRASSKLFLPTCIAGDPPLHAGVEILSQLVARGSGRPVIAFLGGYKSWFDSSGRLWVGQYGFGGEIGPDVFHVTRALGKDVAIVTHPDGTMVAVPVRWALDQVFPKARYRYAGTFATERAMDVRFGLHRPGRGILRQVRPALQTPGAAAEPMGRVRSPTRAPSEPLLP